MELSSEAAWELVPSGPTVLEEHQAAWLALLWGQIQLSSARMGLP